MIVVDQDSAGQNSDVSFRIHTESLRPFFKIYKTGVISNLIPLDRELNGEFKLYIEAYNTNAPLLSRIGVYNVRLEDDNDNRPRFIFPHENSTRLILKFPDFDSFPNLTSLIRVFID